MNDNYIYIYIYIYLKKIFLLELIKSNLEILTSQGTKHYNDNVTISTYQDD